MKRWSSLQRPAVALIVASLAGLAAVPMDWPYRVILALLGLLGLLGWRRSVQEQGKHREAAENNRLIKAMNEYRHDWMNDFQVLFGYIRLKKYDKLLDYMDKINADAYRESYVSKLGLPSLIVYFYSYRTDKKAMELEIEIEREIVLTKLPLDSEKAGELIRRTVELFRENAVEGSRMC
ncbi:Spo0B domain-containing protein [Paenibacillus sp. CC-CFT747]|nr:Spo0B domain-containing protein [Paenibacillus sp. CC-CFT747]